MTGFPPCPARLDRTTLDTYRTRGFVVFEGALDADEVKEAKRALSGLVERYVTAPEDFELTKGGEHGANQMRDRVRSTRHVTGGTGGDPAGGMILFHGNIRHDTRRIDRAGVGERSSITIGPRGTSWYLQRSTSRSFERTTEPRPRARRRRGTAFDPLPHRRRTVVDVTPQTGVTEDARL